MKKFLKLISIISLFSSTASKACDESKKNAELTSKILLQLKSKGIITESDIINSVLATGRTGGRTTIGSINRDEQATDFKLKSIESDIDWTYLVKKNILEKNELPYWHNLDQLKETPAMDQGE